MTTETTTRQGLMDERGFLPPHPCRACNEPLSGHMGDRPAETYAGTATGLCYSCERAPAVLLRTEADGAEVWEWPPHCPSWRRDRETSYYYADCDCRRGTRGSGYSRTTCRECSGRYLAFQDHLRRARCQVALDVAAMVGVEPSEPGRTVEVVLVSRDRFWDPAAMLYGRPDATAWAGFRAEAVTTATPGLVACRVYTVDFETSEVEPGKGWMVVQDHSGRTVHLQALPSRKVALAFADWLRGLADFTFDLDDHDARRVREVARYLAEDL